MFEIRDFPPALIIADLACLASAPKPLGTEHVAEAFIGFRLGDPLWQRRDLTHPRPPWWSGWRLSVPPTFFRLHRP